MATVVTIRPSLNFAIYKQTLFDGTTKISHKEMVVSKWISCGALSFRSVCSQRPMAENVYDSDYTVMLYGYPRGDAVKLHVGLLAIRRSYSSLVN